MSQEVWRALSIPELQNLFQKVELPFWIAGGQAIDLFIGKETRAHEDLDICISRQDQLKFQEALHGWDLQSCDPPGSGIFRSWEVGEALPQKVHNIWCRESPDEHWSLELLLCDFENNQWVYRRNEAIRGPVETFGWTAPNGLCVLSPEIQLLYKSRGMREKDFFDLKNCLRKMSREQKNKLKSWIEIEGGVTHPWIALIGG